MVQPDQQNQVMVLVAVEVAAVPLVVAEEVMDKIIVVVDLEDRVQVQNT
jgi:hypothetical protein